MFENILFQERVVNNLSQLITSSKVPQSMLFYGAPYSGKLSAAAEFARVISCKTPTAPWSCTCVSCNQNRYLLSPYVIMVGSRYFYREIHACGACLMSEDREPLRFLFLRAVRKLVRRFDGMLWQDDKKYTQAIKILEKLDEALDALAPTRGSLDAEQRKSLIEAVYPMCDSLTDLLPQDGINSAMIRHLSYWAHTADSQSPKVIIIESAEMLNETSRNSLLKILEEPPKDVYFILISDQSQSIIPTLRSRLREVEFFSRGANEALILERLFRIKDAATTSLSDFFLNYAPLGFGGTDDLAQSIEGLVLRRAGLGFMASDLGSSHVDEIRQLLPKDRTSLKDVFLRLGKRLIECLMRLEDPAVLEQLRRRSLSIEAAADTLHGIVRTLKDGMRQYLSYNLSGPTVIEAVYSHAGDGPCAVLSKEP